MGEFVHLHVHTEYSLLDGANRIKHLIKRVKELEMDSIAITDHGVMYGIIDFYKEAKKQGVKPIIGCEVYTSLKSRFERNLSESGIGHLVLLAKNNIGFKNLMKIVSIGFTEGFYYKPRIDYEVLRQHSEGIIALTACLGGDISRAILQNNYEKAKEIALTFSDIFGKDNFYLELQINGIADQNLVNQNLIKISKETNIPLVATNDAHYLKKEDAKAHEILLCIQTSKKIDDEDRMSFSSDNYYIKSPDEMKEMFKNIPEAIENTVKISKMCNVEIEFNKLHLPKYYIGENVDEFEYLKKLCFDGLYKKYENVGESHIERLNFELSVILQMGYVDYFLIVWDFIKYARENEIMVGPGRGSAAGSIVSYTLGITNIDPLKYNLLFERFLNPERISMPDIDIDFCYERRQEVIDYVVSKYGKDRVAQIITFGTMAARAAIRDVGRALNIAYSEVDSLAKMIPMQIGMNIEKALEISPELRNKYEESKELKELIDTAKLLEGMPRHSSTHAAGVVISKEPINEYVPLQKNDDSVVTQFTMGLLEEMGLLKMDFLGLRTLTVIRDAVLLIKKNYDINIDIDNLNFEDTEIYKMIGEGKTSGVFQLESSGMTQFMKELKPTSLEDIIAGISLYRPGPMDQIPRYVANKNDPQNVKYLHPQLENILNVTYGCMVYQEQVMQIVRDLAGYSMGRSDLVRRAMSKKKVEVMNKERINFIHGIVDDEGNIEVEGAIRRGVDEASANILFDEMMNFASYAFNKSHAAAYAVIGYQTAFLKCYYPVEYIAALLNSFLGSNEKIAQYSQDAKTLEIAILPPDINESYEKFTTNGKNIRFGLAALKNVGNNAVKNIIIERESKGRFKGFRDFVNRVDGKDINKRCVESLIKAGAFSSFGIHRSQLIAVFESIMDSVSSNRKKNIEGQISFFDFVKESTNEEVDFKEDDYPVLEEYPKKLILSMEKDLLGLYISGHPLDEYSEELKKHINSYSKDLKKPEKDDSELVENDYVYAEGMSVTVGGIITNKKNITTKRNQIMSFVTIEDLFGTIEIIVFPNDYEKYSKYLIDNNPVIIEGKLSVKEDEDNKVICTNIRQLNDLKVSKLYIKIDDELSEDTSKSTLSMFKYFNGDTPIVFFNNKTQKYNEISDEYWVKINDILIIELKERFGEVNVIIR